MSPHVAFKVLQAAERHDFTVVEDDIFCDLQVRTTPRLATLDLCAQLFQDAVRQPARRFCRLLAEGRQQTRRHQDADQHTTSPFTERLIYLMLVDGRYRKYLSRLHKRLGEATDRQTANRSGSLARKSHRCLLAGLGPLGKK